MRMVLAFVVTLLTVAIVTPTQAAPHRGKNQYRVKHQAAVQPMGDCLFFCEVQTTTTPTKLAKTKVLPSPSRGSSMGPRPSRWCGWWMGTQRGYSDRRLNLAWNWSKLFPRTQPAPGAVVVWRGHVGELVAHVKGDIWIVRSGNDGKRVRERARSVRGAVFVSA